jgi:hypothetical protein
MSLTEVVVEGNLNPDGTLELCEKPNLSPGRVTVVLRQELPTPTPTEGWWQFMQSARKRMEEAGSHFTDEKEMQAHIDWLREDDRIDELLHDANRQAQQPE